MAVWFAQCHVSVSFLTANTVLALPMITAGRGEHASISAPEAAE